MKHVQQNAEEIFLLLDVMFKYLKGRNIQEYCQNYERYRFHHIFISRNFQNSNLKNLSMEFFDILL